MVDTFFDKFTKFAKICRLLFFSIALFGCWLAGQANSDHVVEYGSKFWVHNRMLRVFLILEDAKFSHELLRFERNATGKHPLVRSLFTQETLTWFFDCCWNMKMYWTDSAYSSLLSFLPLQYFKEVPLFLTGYRRRWLSRLCQHWSGVQWQKSHRFIRW